jgi:hypothetical protein
MLNASIRLLTILLALAAGMLILSCGDDNPPTSHTDLNRTDLPVLRTSWHLAAMPLQVPDLSLRSNVLWHNLIVYNDGPAHHELRMVFRPSISVIYPYAAASPRAGAPYYAAIYAYVGKTLDKDFQYLELKVRGTLQTFFLDYGWFNQDIDGNVRNNSEDLNSNGACDSTEDVGLDGYSDENEGGYDPQTNPDPHHDDFYSEGYGKCPLPGGICDTGALYSAFRNPANPLYYEYLNGTEGNLHDLAVLGQPDQELVRPTWFTTFNLYRSYQIDTLLGHFLVDGPDANGWRTYRIPVLDSAYDDVVASDIPGTRPDPFDFQMIRLWAEFPPGQRVEDTLEIDRMFLYSKKQ